MKNRMKALRRERGWSQSELAARVGVSRNSIISIENGRFDPSLPLAFELADAFGLKIEDIFEHVSKSSDAEET
ncbi:MAG: helix-turn-helix transcriptional regulator [Pseudomonadota bacterium]